MTHQRLKYIIILCVGLILLSDFCVAQEVTREQELERMGEIIFTRAKSLIETGDYLNATREFIILMNYYPDFEKMDEVVLLISDCMYEMELYTSATTMFTYLVKNYFSSPFLPNALLGLEKTKYKEGKFQESLDFFEAIQKAPRPIDVDDEARYYAGQSYYSIKDYSRTLKTLLELDSGSNYYDYGLYTIGLSLLRMKRVRKAIAIFRKIAAMPILSEERRNVVDEARLTLGFLYFELGYYNQAITYFRDISPANARYPDALLAQGWTFIKLNDYYSATRPLLNLIRNYPDNIKAEEALFLLGRCYLELLFLDEAIVVYDKIIELFPEEDIMPETVRDINIALSKEGKAIEKLRMDLLILETRLIESILSRTGKELPSYLTYEKDKVEVSRDKLLDTIKEERSRFSEMRNHIDQMKEILSAKLERKNWRAYAEYGKSRALFLKGTVESEGN